MNLNDSHYLTWFEVSKIVFKMKIVKNGKQNFEFEHPFCSHSWFHMDWNRCREVQTFDIYKLFILLSRVINIFALIGSLSLASTACKTKPRLGCPQKSLGHFWEVVRIERYTNKLNTDKLFMGVVGSDKQFGEGVGAWGSWVTEKC